MKVDYQRAHFLAPTGLKVNGFRRAGLASHSFAFLFLTITQPYFLWVYEQCDVIADSLS